jgi:transcriptional antiterminator NusG
MEATTPIVEKVEKAEKESKWYVLRVVSGKERKIKEYLDKDIVRNGWTIL